MQWHIIGVSSALRLPRTDDDHVCLMGRLFDSTATLDHTLQQWEDGGNGVIGGVDVVSKYHLLNDSMLTEFC